MEHLSVTLDGPDDRGAFQVRNDHLALIVESGSAEVAGGLNGTVGLLLFYHRKIFCIGWKREARQDVGVRVRVLRSALFRKSVRIQEVNSSLYTIALVRQTCKILKR